MAGAESETMTETIRLNKYIASRSGLSRRDADRAVEGGRIKVNGKLPKDLLCRYHQKTG